jgi:hypothetical protein
LGLGAVSVRVLREGEEFTPVHLGDMPEAFRTPITNALSRAVPDPGTSLVSAVERLEKEKESEADLSKEQLEHVRDLAELHILLGRPIPFDAQTTFFRMLQEAPPRTARKLTTLRGILGFTPDT